MHDRIILVQEEPRGPSQLIEIPVTNGKGKVTFPDVQQLRSQANQVIVIKAIRLITIDLLTNGVITGFVNAPIAELQKMSLVIYCEGWEKAQYLPILELNDTTVPGGTAPHRYHQTRFNNWQNVDWSKTFIQFSNGTTSSTDDGYVVMLDVEYIKLDASNSEIIGPS